MNPSLIFPKVEHGVLLNLIPSRHHMFAQSRERTEYSGMRTSIQKCSVRQPAHVVHLVRPPPIWVGHGMDQIAHVPYLGGIIWIKPSSVEVNRSQD